MKAAPLGTHERFIGFLIESRVCGTGNFPFWLAPDQVRVITLNDAKPIVTERERDLSEGLIFRLFARAPKINSK